METRGGLGLDLGFAVLYIIFMDSRNSCEPCSPHAPCGRTASAPRPGITHKPRSHSTRHSPFAAAAVEHFKLQETLNSQERLAELRPGTRRRATCNARIMCGASGFYRTVTFGHAVEFRGRKNRKSEKKWGSGARARRRCVICTGTECVSMRFVHCRSPQDTQIIKEKSAAPYNENLPRMLCARLLFQDHGGWLTPSDIHASSSSSHHHEL